MLWPEKHSIHFALWTHLLGEYCTSQIANFSITFTDFKMSVITHYTCMYDIILVLPIIYYASIQLFDTSMWNMQFHIKFIKT